MEDLARRIGDLIRQLRKNKGFTQEDLADQASLHETYIGKIERGEKNLSLESLVKISKAMDISLGEFFNMVEPNIENTNNVLYELIDLLKDRSLEEQTDFLTITKTFTKMLDRK